MPAPSPSGIAAANRAALEQLAAELGSGDHDAELVTDDGPVPYLAVSHRHARLRESIYADDRSYFWPWGQPIAAIGNPRAAAEKVRYVLAAPGHSHG
jgi:hypothetical protein